jgi:acetyl-CoA synthetase
VYPPSANSGFDRYLHEYAQSIEDPAAFWGQKAHEYLDWERDYDSVLDGTLEHGDIRWFSGGKLNVAYNAIDRHVIKGKGEQTALLWEGDEPDQVKKISYNELLRRVSQIANALTQQGVKKGDVVTIYMPMIPELPMTMLACARIGAVHSVVFAGFSAEALASRVVAANSDTIVTADIGKRGGKTIKLKNIVDEARGKENMDASLRQVLCFEHGYKEGDEESEAPYDMKDKDVRMNPLVDRQRPYSVPVPMDAEDSLFILYTSGSTGSPKGLLHTTGGYALYSAFTTKTTFDLAEGDVFACVADCGWITGHTYVVYGPLLNGSTTLLFESTPVYPDEGRYWDMVQRHKITQFYTAPTAIRLLMKYDDDVPKKYNLSSKSPLRLVEGYFLQQITHPIVVYSNCCRLISKGLKILGSVGEPINPEAWRWYYKNVGRERCSIVDTYWQTETGGHIITNIPGVTPMKPGSCTLPSYGIEPVVLDAVDGTVVKAQPGQPVQGVLAIRQPWPGMARTCLQDHERYMATYLKPYPGYYFTGDSVMRDEDGYHFITGRVDDVSCFQMQ